MVYSIVGIFKSRQFPAKNAVEHIHMGLIECTRWDAVQELKKHGHIDSTAGLTVDVDGDTIYICRNGAAIVRLKKIED